VTTVAWVLSCGANPKCETSDGCTPLFFAAKQGHLAVVELLLSRQAAADVLTKDRETPLMACSSNGHEAVVRLLLAGAAVNTVNIARTVDSATALCLAARKGFDRVCAALIGAKADMEAEQRTGDTPLKLATRFEQREVVTALLAANANPSGALQHARKDSEIYAILQKAQPPSLAALPTRGFDCGRTPHASGLTPAYRFQTFTGRLPSSAPSWAPLGPPSVSAPLESRPINNNSNNNNNNNSLFAEGVASGNAMLVRWALEQDKDICIDEALFDTVRLGHVAVLRELLTCASPALINAQNESGQTLLVDGCQSCAEMVELTDCVMLLLDAGAG
jgi:hypothetical protein